MEVIILTINYNPVPIKIKYPSRSKIKSFDPYSPHFKPILRIEDLVDKTCLKTPYLRLLKGLETYISRHNIYSPWDQTRSGSYQMYSIHKRVFIEKLLWMIQKTNTDLSQEESTFDINTWRSRLRRELNQDFHILIDLLLETFERYCNFIGNFQDIKDFSMMFDLFLFSPEVPIPRDINNYPFTLHDFIYEREFEDRENVRYSEYFIDPTSKKFPLIASVPLIDFTSKKIILFKYFSVEWMKNYNQNPDIHRLFLFSYILPDLFSLWIIRYALANQSDNLFNFEFTYLANSIFLSNGYPEMNIAGDFNDFSIYVFTCNEIYDESLFETLDLNPSKLLAEKLIVAYLSNSNKANRAKRVEDICPFEDNPNLNLCSNHIGRNKFCIMNDTIRWPPRTYEKNVYVFQKYLRNEYNSFSRYYYWLNYCMKNDDIDSFLEEYNIYIGDIRKEIIGDEINFYYNDLSEDLFYGNPPSNSGEFTIMPFNLCFYSNHWSFESIWERIENNEYKFIISSEKDKLHLNNLFKFVGSEHFRCIISRSHNPELLFLLQNQKKALWSIVRHSSFQNEDESDEQRDQRIIRNKLNNNSKRAGVAIFGKNTVKYRE